MTAETGPFFFAWVEPTDTTFGVEHQVCDEFLYSVSIEHTEDDIPIMTVTMENPGGLMAPGRKRWAWLSWRDTGGHVWPLFFGGIVGVPNGLLGQDVTVQFSAKPLDYFLQQLRIAAPLRRRPFWDPVFIDATERYKPESALLGYPAFWHVDRITGVVTVSDILNGEDGVELFEEGEVPYDSVDFGIDQAPLSIVRIDASVPWTQTATGIISILPPGTPLGKLFDPASVASAWPHAGDSLGDGWSVYSAKATGGSAPTPPSTLSGHNQSNPDNTIVSSGDSNDPFAMVTETFAFQDKSATHNVGDVISVNMSYTHPRCVITGPVEYGPTVEKIDRVYAFVSPVPEVVDQPSGSVTIQYKWDKAQLSGLIDGTTPQGVHVSLVARYDAARQRSEHLLATVKAGVQPVFADMEVPGGFPGGTPDYEELTLTGADVGLSLTDVKLWQDVRDTETNIGEYIRSNDGLNIFVCLEDGIAGAIEPTWNRTFGATTAGGRADIKGRRVARYRWHRDRLFRKLAALYGQWGDRLDAARLRKCRRRRPYGWICTMDGARCL